MVYLIYLLLKLTIGNSQFWLSCLDPLFGYLAPKDFKVIWPPILLTLSVF